eukprot:10246891-Heterocapsa_arctica.AAC.1
MVVLHEAQQCQCLPTRHLQEHEVEQAALHHHLGTALEDGDLVIRRGGPTSAAHSSRAGS